MDGKKQQATIIRADELDKLEYKIPKIWYETAGLLKHKKVDGVAYQRQIRQEWEQRLKKLERKQLRKKK